MSPRKAMEVVKEHRTVAAAAGSFVGGIILTIMAGYSVSDAPARRPEPEQRADTAAISAIGHRVTSLEARADRSDSRYARDSLQLRTVTRAVCLRLTDSEKAIAECPR